MDVTSHFVIWWCNLICCELFEHEFLCQFIGYLILVILKFLFLNIVFILLFSLSSHLINQYGLSSTISHQGQNFVASVKQSFTKNYPERHNVVVRAPLRWRYNGKTSKRHGVPWRHRDYGFCPTWRQKVQFAARVSLLHYYCNLTNIYSNVSAAHAGDYRYMLKISANTHNLPHNNSYCKLLDQISWKKIKCTYQLSNLF